MSTAKNVVATLATFLPRTIKKTLATLANILTTTTKAFLDIHDSDSSFQKAKKVSDTVINHTTYTIADYWIMIASGVFIVIMDQRFGYGPIGLFLLMWAFDIVVALAFIIFWKLTGRDVTLGEGYRRAVDAIHSGSRVIGYIMFALVLIKATFWDGPERIVIFFHKEIRTAIRMLFILLVLTAAQAAIWTPIYVLGFENATELFSHIRSLW